MNQALDKVVDELRGAWRFRWLAMGLAWVVCLVGWLVVFSMPDMYQASSRVFVDSRTAVKSATLTDRDQGFARFAAALGDPASTA
jgi:uncharacterized protein involved in exopolysaccharide biosynthesis